MRVSLRLRRPTAGGVALTLLRAALLVIGLASLGAFLWLQYESQIVHAELQRQFAERVRQAAAGTPAAPIVANGVVGRLRSQRLGLDVMVLDGEQEAQLRRGVGLIDNTAYPGEAGNVGLAAHRDTFFRPLRDVEFGDRFELETLEGRYEYEVEWTRIVDPTAVEVLDPTPEPTLTLVTCYPFNYIGSAPQRFIVRAKQTDAPSPHAAAAPSAPASPAAANQPVSCGATAAVAALSSRTKQAVAGARRLITAMAGALGS